MAVKFIYSRDDGLLIQCEDGDELTEKEARIVAMRDMSNAVSAFNYNFGNFVEAFQDKKFFKRDEG